MLTGPGTLEYLILNPKDRSKGTYEWTTNFRRAQNNAQQYFPNAEGIDRYKNELVFISKRFKLMITLNLDDGTYTRVSTISGLFSGDPDQIVRLTDTDESLLYFTEDGGDIAGVHARNRLGQFYTILESPFYADETTGLSFSPDAKHMYIAYQENGILFDVTRKDGLPFTANTLNVKFHSTDASRR
jgi:hypothetical protein